MMKLVNYLANHSTELPAYISPPDDEFLQAIQRRVVEISQHIQHLQSSDQAETFEMEWLALYLHLSIIKTMIAEKLEQLNESTTYGTHF